MWPGFVEEFNAEFGSPQFKQTQPGRTGFYEIADRMLQTMRDATGNMFDPRMAQGNATEDQFLKAEGIEQGNAIFRAWESSLEDAGKAALALCKEHYDIPFMLKFIDSNKRAKSIQVNTTVFNEQTGEEDGYYIKDIDIDIALSSKSYTPTERLSQANNILRAMQYAPETAIAPLYTEFIKILEIDPEVAEMVEQQLNIIPQMMQQLQQSQQIIEQLQGQIEQLGNQLETADRRMVKSQYEAELQGQISKFKEQLGGIVNNVKANAEIQKKVAQINARQKSQKEKAGKE